MMLHLSLSHANLLGSSRRLTWAPTAHSSGRTGTAGGTDSGSSSCGTTGCTGRERVACFSRKRRNNSGSGSTCLEAVELSATGTQCMEWPGLRTWRERGVDVRRGWGEHGQTADIPAPGSSLPEVPLAPSLVGCALQVRARGGECRCGEQGGQGGKRRCRLGSILRPR